MTEQQQLTNKRQSDFHEQYKPFLRLYSNGDEGGGEEEKIRTGETQKEVMDKKGVRFYCGSMYVPKKGRKKMMAQYKNLSYCSIPALIFNFNFWTGRIIDKILLYLSSYITCMTFLQPRDTDQKLKASTLLDAVLQKLHHLSCSFFFSLCMLHNLFCVVKIFK